MHGLADLLITIELKENIHRVFKPPLALPLLSLLVTGNYRK